jgi:hypothetical protein
MLNLCNSALQVFIQHLANLSRKITTTITEILLPY